jgi:hypothetical protein
MDHHEPQHQRRLALLRRVVGPQVDALCVRACPAQLPYESYVGSHANPEVVARPEERLPKVLADKARIGPKQRLGG